MIMPRHMPPDAYFDDPAEKPEREESDIQTLAFALASGVLARVNEWIMRGNLHQRSLRHHLVAFCVCPHLLPCKRPSAAWCGRQHGVSREYASHLHQEFTREFGDYLQFRGQRFLCQANAIQKSDGAGGGGERRGRSPARSQAHSPTPTRRGAAGTAALMKLGS